MNSSKALYTAFFSFFVLVFVQAFSFKLIASQNTYIATSPMASPDQFITVSQPTLISQVHNRFITSMDSEDLMQSLYLTLLGFRWVWDSPTNTFNTSAPNTPFFDLANQTNAYNIQAIKHSALYHALDTYGAATSYSTNKATYVRTDGSTKDVTVYSLLPFYLDNMFAPYGIYNTLSAYTNLAARYYKENSYNFDYIVPILDPLSGYFIGTDSFMHPFESDEQKQAYFDYLAYSRVITPESRTASLLQNLFEGGTYDSMNIPTGGFEKSKFAVAISNSFAVPLRESMDDWKKTFSVSMAAMNTNRTGSTSLITNSLANTNNKLDALNQALGNPNDLGNNDTLLGRVVHIDEDLHRILDYLDSSGGAGGGGGSSGDHIAELAELRAAINCYWNIDWSNSVHTANNSLSFSLTSASVSDYLDNWEEHYKDTNQGGSDRMRQVLGLIYTQTLLLDDMRTNTYYAALRHAAFSRANYLDNNGINVDRSDPDMEQAINALEDRSDSIKSDSTYTEQLLDDGYSSLESLQTQVSAVSNSVIFGIANIVSPFQIHAQNVRKDGIRALGAQPSPEIRDHTLVFRDADGKEYNISLFFDSNTDFAEFASKTRRFISYATTVFFFIYSIYIFFRQVRFVGKIFSDTKA